MIDEYALILADLGAGWVLWLLLGLSVLTVAVAAERAFYFVRSRSGDRAASLEEASGDDRALEAWAKDARSFEGQVIRAGLEVKADGEAAVAHRMAGTLQRLQLEAGRRLGFLGTVGSNAPFIGLLGTVIGVVRSFQELNAAEGQVTAGLMTEVGEALVATAIGILVALPAVAFYNYFQQLIRERSEQAEASSKLLLARLAPSARVSEPTMLAEAA
ncbi:MAG: MotA/TolQ/ExbB proton channel family protein, partial [Myxococcota bacterium]